jgi:DNA-binding response OmpR family regulator
MNSLPKILLIDDDIDQHNLIKMALSNFTELDCTTDTLQAWALLKRNSYDLLIIDINLSETTGLKFLEELKNLSLATEAIKIMLTASELEKDEIASHKLEVEDFVRKPIKPLAFKALIEKHLKKKVVSNVWIKGRLKINIDQMTLAGKDGNAEYQKIIVTPKEFKILLKLIKNIGQVFSREQIFEGVWDDEDESYLRSIDTHISSLRKKIEPYGAKLLSVRGVGYKIELD